jgi:hypothetical protein
LIKTIEKHNNFDDITASHNQFLSEVQKNFFLTDRILCSLFEDFFVCCSKFNEVLTTLSKNPSKIDAFLSPPPSVLGELDLSQSFSETTSSHLNITADLTFSTVSLATIEYYEMEFDRYLQLIFTYLSRSASLFNSTYVHSLLLHLNFNAYFSRLVNKSRKK